MHRSVEPCLSVHVTAYTDARRVGKIPKFLAHRLYPSARYSIWLDSKLCLQNDLVLILEYFLWLGHYEYAISNHYDRHCVWEEAQQNKKLNKYNHTTIDEQFAFYQGDGLTRFNASDPKKSLPSILTSELLHTNLKAFSLSKKSNSPVLPTFLHLPSSSMEVVRMQQQVIELTKSLY